VLSNPSLKSIAILREIHPERFLNFPGPIREEISVKLRFLSAASSAASGRACGLLVVLVAAAAGCDSGYVKSHSSTGSTSSVTVTVDNDQIRRDKEAFRARTETKLAEWDQKMAEMRDRASKATGQAKADLEREIAAQKPKLEAARQELREIDAMTAEKWAEFKARSSKAWDDISSGFERAFSRFQ
jgi:hypothetical protein